jgi:hypothetical protein
VKDTIIVAQPKLIISIINPINVYFKIITYNILL